MIKFYLDNENNLVVRDMGRGKSGLYPCGTWEHKDLIKLLSVKGFEHFGVYHSTKVVLFSDVRSSIIREYTKDELINLVEGLK